MQFDSKDCVCPRAKYHIYHVVKNHPEAQVEVCEACNHRVTYKKCDKGMDNKKYLQDHVRDFCQPYGPTRRVYLECYGEKRIKENEKKRREVANKSIDEIFAEGVDECKEILRLWRQMDGRGYTFKELEHSMQTSVL